MRIPGLGGWNEDPAWAHIYDWTVEHPGPGGVLWRLGIGSELSRLYAATAEIGRQPAGSSVLDIPCGGGVALRGLRPGQGLRYVAADISGAMLDRTREAAEERGVSEQVATEIADVHNLSYADGEFDLVVSFTGLHCFPDPRQAVREIVRVTAAGGVVSGSAVLTGTGLRYQPLFIVGRAAGLMGRSCSRDELAAWLREDGLVDVTVEVSGAMGYFRGRQP